MTKSPTYAITSFACRKSDQWSLRSRRRRSVLPRIIVLSSIAACVSQNVYLTCAFCCFVYVTFLSNNLLFTITYGYHKKATLTTLFYSTIFVVVVSQESLNSEVRHVYFNRAATRAHCVFIERWTATILAPPICYITSWLQQKISRVVLNVV